MNKVKVTAKVNNLPVDKAWDIITDVKKYPKRVRYVKKVKIYGKGEGSRWDDTTTILWVPLTLSHTITSFKKNREYGFSIPLRFGGKMRQKYVLEAEKSNSLLVKADIDYDLGNNLLNNTLGKLLKRRLRKMLVSSLNNINAQVINK